MHFGLLKAWAVAAFVMSNVDGHLFGHRRGTIMLHNNCPQSAWYVGMDSDWRIKDKKFIKPNEVVTIEGPKKDVIVDFLYAVGQDINDKRNLVVKVSLQARSITYGMTTVNSSPFTDTLVRLKPRTCETAWCGAGKDYGRIANSEKDKPLFCSGFSATEVIDMKLCAPASES